MTQERNKKLAELRSMEKEGQGDAYPSYYEIDKHAGRIVLKRTMKTGMFISARCNGKDRQLFVMASRKELHEKMLNWDLGDIITAKGELFTTKTGETTLRVEEAHLLAKCLHNPPEKHHGLKDKDKLHRQPYIKYMSDLAAQDVLRKRSRIIHEIRNFLHFCGFVEVETPVLQSIYGGAEAQPFMTRHNDMDCPMFLRIAQELHLKRMLVGGFDRVFEIGKVFRNEGMTTKHNPEFTMLELNSAFLSLDQAMNLTRNIVSIQIGKEENPFNEFWRMTLAESLTDYDPEKFSLGNLKNREFLMTLVPDSSDLDLPSLHLALFEEFVEKTLIKPTFIYGYPAACSPFAKRFENKPEIAQRFELFINGMEIANGFCEINDPEQQRGIFQAQTSSSENAHRATGIDEDYLTALEYGMPPNAGIGIGIDRLVMLLTNQSSIKDVIAFPQMRPNNKGN